jgi:KDO2-lipid IV(A) lauroyltransferase
VDRSHWYDFPVYIAVRLLLCVIQALPLETCERLARGLAWLACDILHLRRETVEENLGGAFPEMPELERRHLERQMWEHLFLIVFEVVHAPCKVHDTNWRDYVTVANQREMVSLLLSDRAVVMVSGHYGNFEFSSFMLGLFGFVSYGIARPLDNRFLDRAINKFRSLYGAHILPKHGSAGQVADILKGGGTLGLLADQHAGPKGCWVDFFGRPASTHKAIALFSMGADAPLIVSYSRRTGKMLHHLIDAVAIADPRSGRPEVANVRAFTQWYTNRLEDVIREEPSQYWWLHRRWRDKKPKQTAASSQQAA